MYTARYIQLTITALLSFVHKQLRRIENLIDDKFSLTIEEINALKVQNDTLRDRLSLVESKCASVNRTVSEMQNTYKKE